ncbi:acyl transferase domain-containing protein/acyl carrier protein [Allocatelliglobosispora scoriae]|uniref:Acyl transferase domain-containing protein/acyl carrier protein n=1 Tax=Allocatelliglobosispora scoriae TaxID=643052 RepID=A0A841BZX0_9ACTN|nr:type I polyketide synthase [Allocatelliglobosispora scoriae]MBB5873235.1 acyl transferase domain-containing protein/acyl carrier protein [Allocatelliglobosispora scoriae]
MFEEANVEPIAVIGLACRFPSSPTAGQFWRNLVDGVDCVRHFTAAEQSAFGVPDHELADPNFVMAAPVLDDMENFDAALFGLTKREAELRDPQHRLFLELGHTALEDAGYDPARYAGEIGVYGGIGADEYQWRNLRRNAVVMSGAGSLSILTAAHPDYLATHLSHNLDLRGPSLTMHTACSTTLVAFHIACEALRNGECDMALTGGASIELPHGHGYIFTDGGILSPDGRTRTFDASAQGTLWGSGGGVVLLKRLSDAIADGDHIRAIVRGSAVNNDGANKVGFSAPSLEGQQAVVTQALGVADVDPRTITYVETHGTATGLGDPIEVGALASIFRQHSEDIGWCGLGSVKTNIGHLGPVAGIAGIIKTVLSIEHGILPPSLHFERPNPKLSLETSPFYVNATLAKWQPVDGHPLRAGVSSFGIGGTNAHVVLEQAPAVERPHREPRPSHLVQISARTETALTALTDRLATHLAAHPETELGDVAYTLRVGRRALPHRAVVVATTATDAAKALTDRKRKVVGSVPARVPRVAFLLSGQGAQFAGMGAQLYRTEPVYAAAVDECLRVLGGDLAEELRGLLLTDEFETPAARTAADSRLAQTALTQPALFIIEYALAQLWAAWGVRPAAMIGHSIGEYVAATLAGVFSLPDAVRLVAARGRLMQSMPNGSMLAVRLDEAELAAKLPDGISIATVNGPGACVVAGATSLIEDFAVALDAEGVGSKMLRTSHAFHSPMMEPILGEFRDLVAAAERHAPQAAFLSNVTGGWISPAEATDPSYWARHLRDAVRFGDCVAALLADGDWLLVECGPGKQLAGLARMHTPREATAPIQSLPGQGESKTDLQTLYAAVGQLWTAGVAVDQAAFGEPGLRVPLVPYPYERKRYWIEPTMADISMDAPEPTGPRPVEQWFTVPAWRQAVATPADAVPERCLVFRDGPASSELAAGLRSAGAVVIEVSPGSAFAHDAGGGYTVRPGARDDYDALLAALAADGMPGRVVHAWALDGEPAGLDPDLAWQAQDRGFFSLLNLVQATAAAQLTVHIDAVTAGTQDAVGGDATRPEHATVVGIAKVVPLENPAITVRHIDTTTGGRTADVLGEVSRAPQDKAVALRGGRRWVQEWEPVTLPAAPDTNLRDGGTYLITGGLGGLGITLAEDLAVRHRANLVLLSRSGLPPREQWQNHLRVHGTADRVGRAIAAIGRMEAAGGRVLALGADVNSADDLRRVRTLAIEEFGTLDGIVHAAGVPGGGMAEVKERAVAEAVLAPKVAGTLALHRAFGDLPLDFVALFSSVTAVAGGFGQVDYCGANNFLDSYARGDHGWNAQVTSMNWGGWLEVGMAAEVAAPASFRALQRGDRASVVDHPVITARHGGDGDQLAWASGVVAPDTHWVLDEHRIAGVPVMPGTGHLENVRSAFAAVRPGADGTAVELRDVVFVQPMSVADGGGAEVRVEFAEGTDGADFQVVSVSAGATATHVQGNAGWVPVSAAPVVDIDAIRARCLLATHEIDGGDDVSHSGLLTFGSRWGSLRRVDVGAEEQLALLEVPAHVAAELDRWVLHPALLDEATSFARGAGEGQYLPMGYGKLLVRDSLPARIYSHLRFRAESSGEIITADITIYDETGRELVAISDFALRRVDRAAMTETVQQGGVTVAGRLDTAASTETGISRADGAEAFRRVLARVDAQGLGHQIVITAQSLQRVFTGVASVTQETVADEFDGSGTGGSGGATNREGYVAPRTELESSLASVWGAVLGVDSVGAEDDFFDLGGNSLIAVQLISQIRKTVGVKLPLRSLFETPTVSGMAGLVEGLRAAEQS